MIYHFYHCFGLGGYHYITDEEKMKIAKLKAAEDLAKKLLENAEFKVNDVGDVEGFLVLEDRLT